jgi:hypothetical protein
MNKWTPEQWKHFLDISDEATLAKVDAAIKQEVSEHYLLHEFLDKLGLLSTTLPTTPTRRALIVGICVGWAEGWRQADFFWSEK